MGDIVVIRDEKMPRQQWRLGRVIELIIGRDKRVRAAKVLVGKTGVILDRPINLLYPLEQNILTKSAKNDVVTNGIKEAAINGESQCKINS